MKRSFFRTSQCSLCRCFLCSMARIGCCHCECTASWRNDFLLPVSMRVGILCISDDHGCRICRHLQDDSIGSSVDTFGFGCIGSCLFMVDQGIRSIYWAIHCGFSACFGRVSRPFLLHFFGMVNPSILDTDIPIMRVDFMNILWTITELVPIHLLSLKV